MLKRHIKDSRFFASNTAIAAIGVALAGVLVAGEGIAKQKPGFVLVGTGVALPSVAVAYFSRYQVAACDAFARYLRALDDRIAAAEKNGKLKCEQTHPGLIREAIASADRQYRQQLAAATSEARRQGYSDGVDATRSQLEESRQKAIAQFHQRHADERAELEIRHEKAIAQLRSDSQSELTQLVQQHKTAIGKLQQRHATERGELEVRIADLQSQIQEWEQKRSDIDSDLATIQEWRVEMARHEGKIEQLESERLTFDMRLEQMEDLAKAKTQELLECIGEEREAGFLSGYEKAASEFAADRDRLILRNEQLKVQLSEKNRRDKFERSLPEMADVVGVARKPYLIVGSQGSGKALSAVAVADAYEDGAGVVMVALDISEGRDPDSTWRRLSIPCTDDPVVFLELMEAIVDRLESLPFRNNIEAFSRQPVIIPIIDEAMCAFASAEKSTAERVISSLRALETRGSKHKVFPASLTQNDQIQNLAIGSKKLFNTGVLSNYYRIYLNDGFTAHCSEDRLGKQKEITEYLDAYENHFKAGVESYTKKGLVLKPTKHASHHGNLLSESVPSRFPSVKLAPAPAWFPRRIRNIFEDLELGCESVALELQPNDRTCDRTSATPALAPNVIPLQRRQEESCTLSERKSDRTNTGVSDFALDGVPADVTTHVRDCISADMNQAKTIEKVWGLKRNYRNPEWQKAREIYNSIKKEVKEEDNV